MLEGLSPLLEQGSRIRAYKFSAKLCVIMEVKPALFIFGLRVQSEN